MSIFSERLVLARKKIGLTQQDMADCFNITRSAYSAWEIGRNEPPFSFILDFCRTYKISADYLIGLSDSMDPPVAVSITPAIVARNPYEDLTPEHRAALGEAGKGSHVYGHRGVFCEHLLQLGVHLR